MHRVLLDALNYITLKRPPNHRQMMAGRISRNYPYTFGPHLCFSASIRVLVVARGRMQG